MKIGQDKPVRILVVDDDPNMLNLTKFYLIKEKVEIHPCNSGQEALKILGDHSFDLILIDILMPQMDGHTLLKKMITEQNIKIPIIVVTAHGPTDNLMSLIDDGAYDILQKPFTSNRLKLTLFNALRYKCLSKQMSESSPEPARGKASR